MHLTTWRPSGFKTCSVKVTLFPLSDQLHMNPLEERTLFGSLRTTSPGLLEKRPGQRPAAPGSLLETLTSGPPPAPEPTRPWGSLSQSDRLWEVLCGLPLPASSAPHRPGAASQARCAGPALCPSQAADSFNVSCLCPRQRKSSEGRAASAPQHLKHWPGSPRCSGSSVERW